MPEALEPAALALLCAGALVAGWVDAVAGGGGLITLPALLAAGAPPHLALGTNKMAGTFGTLSSSLAYVRSGVVHPRHWRLGMAATLCGSLAGTLAVWVVSPAALRRIVPLLILGAALFVLLRRPRPPGALAPSGAPPAPLPSVVLGLLLGFYDGFLGPGVGAFWVTAAMVAFHLDLLRASGVARLMNFVSNLASLGTFLALGLVDLRTGLAMGLSLMLGSHVGARSAIRFGAGFIRPVFVLVVMAIAGRLAWQEWSGR